MVTIHMSMYEVSVIGKIMAFFLCLNVFNSVNSYVFSCCGNAPVTFGENNLIGT